MSEVLFAFSATFIATVAIVSLPISIIVYFREHKELSARIAYISICLSLMRILMG
jgi:hypothetical protein